MNLVIDSISDVLVSTGPSAELGDAAGLYDWLIGRWSVRVIDYDAGEDRKESRGEWHFSWVLEGRAIQDVFIVPVRSDRVPGMSKVANRYGTTLRFYDPEIDAWRITWTNPVRAVQNQLVARKIGNEIVQDGYDKEGRLVMRWCFRDMQQDSFHWTGEESSDNGKTWRLGVEFFAQRK